MNKVPILTLVGAGPGDPDLISLKGIKRLRQADVILYDALVNRELLKFSRKAIKIFAGKRAGIHALSQNEINKMIVYYAYKYGHVVRLKCGDPFVFGRGSEEIEYAVNHGLRTEIVPGISSAIAVPGLWKIPLTRRGISSSFWVIAGTTENGFPSASLVPAIQSGATLVILMGLARLDHIVQPFLDAGKNDVPVAILENGSLPEGRIISGKIRNIRDEVIKNNIKSPAIIVIGEVVRIGQQINQLREQLQEI